MRLVENDETKGTAQPAVIIAGIRTGGTFLSHCLSNHPDIFCDRGESLHHASLWNTYLAASKTTILWCLTHMHGYRVSMCRLIYNQAFQHDVWASLVSMQPSVIWLTRDNVIRQAVSSVMNQMARQGTIHRPAHSFDDPGDILVQIAPEEILAMARKIILLDTRARLQFQEFNRMLRLTYERVAAAGDHLSTEVGQEVCEFLGVRYAEMECSLKRINPQPLRVILLNWDEVSRAILASEFAQCLEGET